MKVINFENISMDFFFDGELKIFGKNVNSVLFEFHNRDVLINAYLQASLPFESFEEMIEKQIRTIKHSDYSNAKNEILKEELGNMENIKISDLKKIKTKFKNSGILLIEKNDLKQLQFYIELDDKILILGMLMLREKLDFESLSTQTAIKQIIKSVNSIKIIQ